MLRLPQSPAAGAFLGLWCSVGIGMAQEQAAPAPESFATTIRPLLTQYCCKCHSTERHKGDLDLEQFTSLDAVRQHPDIWQLVVEQVGSGEMPPAEKPQPEPAQRQQLLGFARAMLDELARANAGDPGPVVLRRLSNAEFTYTIRDLTGVESLAPMREFPADGAAGEGFTNVGNALVVSPMLLEKYLDAARGIAAHAVLLPDGIGFSAGTDRREWTEECLARIRAFHRRFTEEDGGERVDLQGIVFATNGGGRLPLAKYLTATLALRDTATDAAAVATLARERDLSPKYLGILLAALQANEPSPLLDPLRARWRAAGPTDVEALAAQVASWQRVLFRFQSVGHIGKVGGPRAWLESVDPLVLRQEFRLPISPTAGSASVALQLRATNGIAGDTDDVVVWRQPRLRIPGGPDLPLRSVPNAAAALLASRTRGIASAEQCLLAAAAIQATPEPTAAVAQRHGVEPGLLDRWLDYLGIGDGGTLPAFAYLADPIHDVAGHAFVDGFGRAGMPCLLTNASDGSVRV
ncbi:MAG: DUF1587 domain-containing protein, partial [Planctomycetota bacterium]|nr:DUF1587 domain-containing protein [Planctomycetota bacterium]